MSSVVKNQASTINSLLHDLKKAHAVADTFLKHEKVVSSQRKRVNQERLEKELKHSKWRLETKNNLQVVFEGKRSEFVFGLSFILGIEPLIKAVEARSQAAFHHYSELLDKLAQNESLSEMAGIVSGSVLPKSYGLSEQIHIESVVYLDEQIPAKAYAQKSPIKVSLTSDGETVKFDYSSFINELTGTLMLIDSGEFSEQMWMPIDSFRETKKFEKTVTINKKKDQDYLSLIIRAQFLPNRH
jgi:hypothetical protein